MILILFLSLPPSNNVHNFESAVRLAKNIRKKSLLLWAFLKFSVAAATATATFNVLSEQADDHEEFKKNSIGQKFELT